jgi:apolipoprotein D and lipocalin family protein
MRRAALPLVFALPLALAACARAPEAPPPAAPSFREAGAPIASTTRGGLGDLAGDWVISAAVPGPGPAAPGARVTVIPVAAAAATWLIAGPGGTASDLYVTAVPGRHVPQGGGPELWVLWVDDGFRTAAVGTPDGSLGWVMDRPGAASPDRALAAREMLDFNGYDTGALRGG